VVIIGGGFAGLSAAYELVKKGLRPLIIEKKPLLGGMASCFQIDDFWIEKFYHHFFNHDREVISLLQDLGKKDELIWRSCKMGYYAHDTLYSFTTPMDLLKFKEIGFFDRLKFGLFSLAAKKKADVKLLDSMSAEEWLQGTIGSQGYKKTIAPLMRSKFGLHMDDISAAFLKGRLEARAQSRSTFMRREMLGYYRGGLQRLISALSAEITRLGGIIKPDTRVIALSTLPDGSYVVRTSRDELITCDDVIITVPLPVLEDVMKPFADQSFKKIFDYRAAICVCVGLAQKLSDYYWINIASDEIPFGVIVEHTNFVDDSFYQGNKILYISGYFDTSSTYWDMDDRTLFRSFINGVKRIFPAFSEHDLLWWRVARERYATPVFRRDFQKSLQDMKSRLPSGMYLAGNLLTYPMSRNVNNVIQSGKHAVQEMLSRR
jgi:protoporphyrinogen oxidase